MPEDKPDMFIRKGELPLLPSKLYNGEDILLEKLLLDNGLVIVASGDVSLISNQL